MTHPILPETNDVAKVYQEHKKSNIKFSWFIMICMAAMLGIFYGVRTMYQQELDDTLKATHLAKNEIATLQVRLAGLEDKITEVKALQAPLEQSLLFLNHTREEILLADIEQVLDTTSQQLRLTGNIPSAIAALQGIELRLSALSKSRFANLRSAIRHDLLMLKNLRSTDIVGAAFKLDQAIAVIDRLPLLSSQHIESEQTSLLHHILHTAQGWEDIWQSIKGAGARLLTVRHIDDPVALLISPKQEWFIRENLKLRLLNARIALLIRNQTSFQADLNWAQEVLKRYFDIRSANTKNIKTILQDVQKNAVNLVLPTLTSIVAIQQARVY